MLHTDRRSLAEINSSVPTAGAGTWKRFLAFAGPAYLVSIGYMDPGNWATDLEGGSRFGYQLLWVLVVSNAMAILLQTLSARLGIVTRRDLAQACRDTYPIPVSHALWALSEIAIAATDLAEVLGAAIALELLFRIPLLWGVLITAVDSFFVLYILKLGVQRFEMLIRVLVGAIGVCFAIQLALARPDLAGIASGLVPRINGESLYVAIGILGATVMPHNLYLHSSLVQTRQFGSSDEEKRKACHYNLIDSTIALNAALLVNAAILILAASVFFRNGVAITEIQQAHLMLSPLLGTSLASVLFGISLLIAGQASTVTGTLSGQIVMEGFLNLRVAPWLRRFITRAIAITPAVAVIWIAGEGAVYNLLILSQVILSLQLPFAIIPLVRFTADRGRMGTFVNPRWVTLLAILAAALILALNGWLVARVLRSYIAGGTPAWLLWIPVLLAVALLAYLLLEPLRKQAPKAAPALPVEGISAEELQPPEYRNILIPLDHSTSDRMAVRHGLSLARQSNARIWLLHVEEGVTSQIYKEQSRTAEERAGEDYLRTISENLRKHQLEVEYFIRHSSHPAEEIIRFSREHRPDVIVMAAHGHGSFGDLVYGQTIDRVRHGARIPVFVVQ
jgi:manganese transport protein